MKVIHSSKGSQDEGAHFCVQLAVRLAMYALNYPWNTHLPCGGYRKILMYTFYDTTSWNYVNQDDILAICDTEFHAGL